MEKENEFPSLLPIAMRVAAKTISDDLVFYTQDEINSVKNRLKQENRDGKIESILDNKEFEEKKIEDDIEYKKLISKGVKPMSGPSCSLLFLDFQYGTNSII